MYKCISRYLTIISLLMLLAPLLVHAGASIPLEKRLANDQLSAAADRVDVSLYESHDVIEPITVQTFFAGEWQLVEQNASRFLRVAIDAGTLPETDQPLWYEIEADGVPLGQRELLRDVTAGVTFALGNALNMDGNVITGLAMPIDPDPLLGSDAANRAYVDNTVAIGNSATATALAADGANCAPGYYPLGVDAQGAAQGCTKESSGDNLGNHTASQSLDMENNRIVDLAPPTEGKDAANKSYVDSADTTGNAATATALAADPPDCPVGRYARGVNEFGYARGCDSGPALNPGVGDMQYWDGSAWVVIPAPGVDEKVLAVCSGIPKWVWATSGCQYAIGEKGPAGGIVFYVADGGLRGLEAAPEDQASGAFVQWGCYGKIIPGADYNYVGGGAKNTQDILSGCATLGIAARVADDYTLNGFTDWFLPSRDTLKLLYDLKDVVGGFVPTTYWSSTEISSSYAWSQGFYEPGRQESDIKTLELRVRAVRAFGEGW